MPSGRSFLLTMRTTQRKREASPVVVVGAGSSGLAAAAMLARSGVRAVVLERAGHVADSWRRRYDHLRLHTPRGLSGLPGMRIPRQAGLWVARDDLVRYLEDYQERHGIDVRTHATVERIEPATDTDGFRWRVITGQHAFAACAVVVAAGRCHTPKRPR